MSEEKIRTDANQEDGQDELTSVQLEEVAGGANEQRNKRNFEEKGK